MRRFGSRATRDLNRSKRIQGYTDSRGKNFLLLFFIYKERGYVEGDSSKIHHPSKEWCENEGEVLDYEGLMTSGGCLSAGNGFELAEAS